MATPIETFLDAPGLVYDQKAGPRDSLVRTCNRVRLRTGHDAFGTLRQSSAYLADSDASVLLDRLKEDGYLFLPGLLPRETVHMALNDLLEQLGINDSSSLERFLANFNRQNLTAVDRRQTVIKESHEFEPGGVAELPGLRRLLDLMSRLLGGEARLLDRTLVRLVAPGGCTMPHSDIVYAGRGSGTLLTCWIPLVNVPIERGPMMILGGSHRLTSQFKSYWKTDHDRDGNWRKLRFRHGRFFSGSAYSVDARRVQEETKLPWLTANFRSGDILLFDSRTMHCTLDNRTPLARISMDARYQLTSDLPDPRWVGIGSERHITNDRNIYGISDILGTVGRRAIRTLRKHFG
jgi:hypothetical protein